MSAGTLDTGSTASTPSNNTSKQMGGLIVLSLAQFLIALDYSVVYVALPDIGADLNMSESALQWVVSAYAVLFAGFLILGGRLGDRIGARRVFRFAIAWFGIASLAAGLAQDSAQLLLARGAQGLGAALMQPAIIALISMTFAAGAPRNRAMSVWGTIGASGLAAGAILGGVLTTASWRWTMLINLPLALACAIAAGIFLPAALAKVRDRRPVSALGATLATSASLLIVAALTWAATDGWDTWRVLTALPFGLALLAAFVLQERAAGANALIAPRLRRQPWLRLGAASTALYMASVGAEFFVLTLALQELHGYGPLAAGLGFLPLAGMIVLGNMAAGRLIGRYSAPKILCIAFIVDAIGLLMLAANVNGDSYLIHLLPGILVSGFGHGLTYTSMFVTGTNGIEPEDQGTAGAVLTTAQYFSAAASLAVLVLVMEAVSVTSSYAWAFTATALFAIAGAAVAWVAGRRLAWNPS